MSYLDEEGDDVVVSSDDELMTMLQALNGDVIKLFIYCKGNEVRDNDCDIVFTAVAGHPNGKLIFLVDRSDWCNHTVQMFSTHSSGSPYSFENIY